MSDYGKIADGIGQLIVFLFVLCCVFVPLGMWKLVEIIIWLVKHIHILWN